MLPFSPIHYHYHVFLLDFPITLSVDPSLRPMLVGWRGFLPLHWVISNILLNFFFTFFMYFFYIWVIILWWLLMPMPTIMIFTIASVLPASRLWCNWLFFLMNLSFRGPFTAIPNPIGPPFHLLPWTSKDEKTSSRIWVQENKITSKQRHRSITNTQYISHE